MSRSVTLVKGKNNMIGISIGGGAPLCPILYLVQVFHRTPAFEEGSLCPGDELVSINDATVKGFTRKETANLIQSSTGPVEIRFNRIEPPKGKSMDIMLEESPAGRESSGWTIARTFAAHVLKLSMKKVKHRMVEKMKDSTADSLGLSRAVLVNDKLIKKVEYLENNARVYRGIAEQARNFLIAVKKLAESQSEFGQVFCDIGVYETQTSASLAFTNFGLAHRCMGDEGRHFVATVGPMLKDLSTFLDKAVPDAKLTLKKYSNAKFEFLSYCLKVKEMDDEEYDSAVMHAFSKHCQELAQYNNSSGQLLSRVLSGNYEYRVFLRCRHAAKMRFLKLRSDVLVKLQLLDNKRVQDVAFQLERLVAGMYVYNRQCHKILKPAAIFPIEVQLGADAMASSRSREEGAVEGEEEKVVVKEEGEDEEMLILESEGLLIDTN